MKKEKAHPCLLCNAPVRDVWKHLRDDDGLDRFEIAVVKARHASIFCDHYECNLHPEICRVKSLARELRRRFEMKLR